MFFHRIQRISSDFQGERHLSMEFPAWFQAFLRSPPTPPSGDLDAWRRSALRRLATPPNAAAPSESYPPAAVERLFIAFSSLIYIYTYIFSMFSSLL